MALIGLEVHRDAAMHANALRRKAAQQRLPWWEGCSTDPSIIDDLGPQKCITAIQLELPGQQYLKTSLDTARLRLADIQETWPWPTDEGNQVLYVL